MITPGQKVRIVTSLKRLSCPAIELMECFYDTLFRIAPQTEHLFDGDMQKQYEKLLEMIMLVVHALENLDRLVVAVEELGAAHSGYGVSEADYAHVGEALLTALSISVRDWTEEDYEAWATLYGYLSDLMMTGARGEMQQVG